MEQLQRQVSRQCVLQIIQIPEGTNSSINQLFKGKTLIYLEHNSFFSYIQIPSTCIVEKGFKASSLEVILIVLRRLSFPVRLCDLGHLFDLSIQHVHSIIKTTMKYVYLQVNPNLCSFNHQLFDEERCTAWCRSFSEKSELFFDVVGLLGKPL